MGGQGKTKPMVCDQNGFMQPKSWLNKELIPKRGYKMTYYGYDAKARFIRKENYAL